MGRPSEQEIKDIRDEPAKERAYTRALRVTEEAPKKRSEKTGIEAAAVDKAITDDYKKFGSVESPKDDQRIQSAAQAASRAARGEIKRETRGMAPDAYKKGGMTASKRADGIAQRGKTRGTIVMCGGGYMKGKK